MRPLRDRLAECLRWSRLGNACGPYQQQPDSVQNDWRDTADRLLEAAKKRGIEIKDGSA